MQRPLCGPYAGGHVTCVNHSTFLKPAMHRRIRCVSRFWVGACIAVAGITACSGQAGARSDPAPQVVIPSSAPDAYPAHITSDRYPGGSVVRDIVVILFEPSASLETRRSAISFISGTVIGGIPRLPGEEGHYVVRVPPTGSLAELFAVMEQLDPLPGVVIAAPLTILQR